MLNGLFQYIPFIILVKISLLEALIVFNTSQKTRSGGQPKFPPLFQLEEGDFNFFNGNWSSQSSLDTFHNQNVMSNTKNVCGTRSIRHYPRRNGKIVGGSVAPYGAYPWQVEIQIFNVDKNVYEHHCGGAIVGDRLILTAAHCIYTSEPHHIRLVIGNHDLKRRDSFEHNFRVDQIVLHPEFRRSGPYSNDIALIKVRANTASRVMFNSHVQPICLPKYNGVAQPGAWCTVTGWGAQYANDKKSLASILRAAAVPLLDIDLCRNSEVNGGRQQTILDTMLCAGFLQGGVDACGGDSGSPLACEFNNRFVLVGLVSWGDGCAQKNRPGVYTKVDAYVDWIHRTMTYLSDDR